MRTVILTVLTYTVQANGSANEGTTMALASMLRTLRASRKLTLQQVADELKVSKPHVWELEKGTSKNPSADTLMKLSKLYSVSIDDLLGNGVSSNEDAEVSAMLRTVTAADLTPQEKQIVRNVVEGAVQTLKAQKDIAKGLDDSN
jgi:transcriptional regulator with XRE-family HTH domain